MVGFERALKDATVVHQVIFATVKKNIGLLVTPHQDEVVGSDEDDGPGSSVLLSNGITLRSQGTLLVLVGGTTSSTSSTSSSTGTTSSRGTT